MNESSKLARHKQNPYRVLVVTPGSLSYGGGGENLVIDLANHFANYHIGETTVIESKIPNAETRVSNPQMRIVRDVKLESCNYVRDGPMKFLNQYRPPIDLVEQGDVLLVMTYRLPSSRFLLQLKERNIKTVFLVHGIAFERLRISIPLIDAYQIYLRAALIVKRKLLNFDKFSYQVLNNRALQALSKYGRIEFSRLHLIENGLHSEDYVLSRNDDDFVVLFIGRIDNVQKGIRLLVKIVKLLEKIRPAELKIIAIGSGKDESILNIASSRFSTFSYLGFVDKKRKLDLLTRSNLLVCTSNLEPFSMAILEAIFSGLPVVSVPASGPESILMGRELLGKVSIYSAKGMSKDILQYYNKWLNSKADYFEQKRKIFHSSRQIFHIDNMFAKYDSLIQRRDEEE